MDDFLPNYRRLTLGALTILVLALSYLVLQPFLPALLWALVLTVLMLPFKKRFCRRMSESMAALATTFATICIIIVPLVLIGGLLFFQVSNFAGDLTPTEGGHAKISMDSIAHEVDGMLRPLYETTGVRNDTLEHYVAGNKQKITEGLTKPLGQAAFHTIYTLFTLVVALLSMFFMLRDGHKLRGLALDFIPLPKERANEILDRIGHTIHAVFVGVVLVALIQGTIAGITYALLGIPNALMLAVGTIILCTIPLLGAPVIYVPLSLILMGQGQYTSATIMLAVGFIVISNIDNLLRPLIIGARIDLHPLAVFFALLGGVLFFGPVGLMAGPMLLTVLLALLEIVRERLLLVQETSIQA